MRFVRNTIILFIVLSAVAFVGFKKIIEQPGPLAVPVVIDINKGSSSYEVANLLFKYEVISNPFLFRVLAKIKKADVLIKAGEYNFDAGLSMLQVLDKLTKGDVVYHKVTIPEGYTVGQILYLLSMVDNLSGEFDVIPNEGTIFPETYTFSKGKKRMDLVNEAKSVMRTKLKDVWDNRDEGLPYKNINEMLIMASIIEKETGINDERAKVASVFINRLKKGMLLQTDPTVIYAITEGMQNFGRSLTRKDLKIDSPYNTYKYAGLPPTPICNPGFKSIYAAAHPADTDYLYFVANGQGGHNFARTLSEHNKNVAHWKKVR